MYSGDRSWSEQHAGHLPPSGHVCPLQSGHEPGTGLSGKISEWNCCPLLSLAESSQTIGSVQTQTL